MDKEFHYYITYLVAARAGYPPEDAATIAHACQMVDDNTVSRRVEGAPDGKPCTSIFSQSMNAWKVMDPARERHLYPIYMAFHFIPGEPARESAWRKDGRMHTLETTPNSFFARFLLARALKSKSLYRIGIAAHAYADTWAHQNFTGCGDPFNSLTSAWPLNIGHAEAGHDPDPPGREWTDPRLVGHHEKVNNTDRCLQAARHLFHFLWREQPDGRKEPDERIAMGHLLDHLREDIGGRADGPAAVQARETRYKARALRPNYRESAIPEYDPNDWFRRAAEESAPGVYRWKDPANYQGSDWLKFQNAVKFHFDLAWSLFSADIEDRMDLKTPRAD